MFPAEEVMNGFMKREYIYIYIYMLVLKNEEICQCSFHLMRNKAYCTTTDLRHMLMTLSKINLKEHRSINFGNSRNLATKSH